MVVTMQSLQHVFLKVLFLGSHNTGAVNFFFKVIFYLILQHHWVGFFYNKKVLSFSAAYRSFPLTKHVIITNVDAFILIFFLLLMILRHNTQLVSKINWGM